MKLTKTVTANHVDEGSYIAQVTGVKENPKGNYGPFLMWFFKLKNPTLDQEPLGKDAVVTGITPCEFEAGKKLDMWLQAMGIVAETGEVVDTQDAIGTVVRILVEDYEGKDGVTSRVMKVTAAKRRVAPVPQEEVSEPVQTVKVTPPKPAPVKPAQQTSVTPKPTVKVAAPVQEDPVEDAVETPTSATANDDDLFNFDP